MAARVGIVLFLAVLIIFGAALAAEARVVPGGAAGYAATRGIDDVQAGAGAGGGRWGGIRRGRWNVQSLDDARRKLREVPGGPDPQHHN